jgi:hypothetical protein
MYAFGETKVFAYFVASSTVCEELSVADIRLAYTRDPELATARSQRCGLYGGHIFNGQANGDLATFDCTRACMVTKEKMETDGATSF